MGTYINGTGCVSPQKSWDAASFLEEVAVYEGRMVQCMEPEVDPGLEDKYLRRMSRLIRLGWTAAKLCCDDAGLRPDAIVTGSGWGSVLDSEKFLLSMYKNKENFLPPTPFIQSTHNALGAQIAMLLNSSDYNMAYAHGSFAFEQALMDGMMRLETGESRCVLAGGFDEITANQFILMDRLGTWREEPVSTKDLYDPAGKGTLAGEGFAFFALQNEKTHNTYAEVVAAGTWFGPEPQEADDFLKHSLEGRKVDLVLAGLNGDAETDRSYMASLGRLLPQDVCVAAYKHLCGEYLTASGFATWLAARMLRHQAVPAGLKRIRGAVPARIRHILIYHQHQGERHSFILLNKTE